MRTGRNAPLLISARPIRALKRAERRGSVARVARGRPPRCARVPGFPLGRTVLVVRSARSRGPKRVLMDGHEALADLKPISVQIECAVIADQSGAVQACSPEPSASGYFIARVATEICELSLPSRLPISGDALA